MPGQERRVPGRVLRLLPVLLLVLTGAAAGQRLLPTADTMHPRLKFADSLVSANDRCMVSHKKLNPRVRPVYVNGVPMGFC